MVSTKQFKGILAICGGVLIHLSLGTLYTFGEYITLASLEFVNFSTVFSAFANVLTSARDTIIFIPHLSPSLHLL